MSTTCSGCCASSRPPRRWCPHRCMRMRRRPTTLRRDLFRLDRAGHATRRLTCWKRRACIWTRCGSAPFPSARRWSTSSPRTNGCSSSSRTATRRCARCWSTNAQIDPARLSPVLHYDGTPITARFITRAICRRAWTLPWPQVRRPPNDLDRQAEAAPPDPADQRAGLHPARLRGPDLDAVRRLRARLDLRGDHPGLLRARHRSRTGSPSCRASAVRRRRPTISWASSHGFNSVHGRMPSVLTGANLANRDLIYLGVSGDGDRPRSAWASSPTAMRRGVNMTYIVENNGVYGLTKGQFSATADKGSKTKKRRQSTTTPHRSGRLALHAGRDLRGPQLLRRQGAARAADQGGDGAPGRGLHRRHQPLRAVQQPRRQSTKSYDYRARAQRGGEPARRDRAARSRSRWTTSRARRRGRPSA